MTNTANTANTIGRGLPEGWTYEALPGKPSFFLLTALGNAGYVTLEFGRDVSSRGFRAGLGAIDGKYRNESKIYKGRNWQVTLMLDAVEWLKSVIQEIS